MASTAAGRVGVVVAPVTSTSSDITASRNGGRTLQMAGSRDVVSCWGQPRVVATSSFFGMGVDRFVLRASNVSYFYRYPSRGSPFFLLWFFGVRRSFRGGLDFFHSNDFWNCSHVQGSGPRTVASLVNEV